jgi:hypothetical protein
VCQNRPYRRSCDPQREGVGSRAGTPLTSAHPAHVGVGAGASAGAAGALTLSGEASASARATGSDSQQQPTSAAMLRGVSPRPESAEDKVALSAVVVVKISCAFVCSVCAERTQSCAGSPAAAVEPTRRHHRQAQRAMRNGAAALSFMITGSELLHRSFKPNSLKPRQPNMLILQEVNGLMVHCCACTHAQFLA